MELVDGLSLRDYLRTRGPLEHDLVIPLAAAVASGLARAHEREVIHRDVKPGNVLLGHDGAVKVSDFGLAFVVSSLTVDPSGISGTPGFVPPEVLSAKPYAEPGDLFGLGATLYESLTGFHPLTGLTLRETINNTLKGKVKPLRDCVKVPEDLASLVERMLATDPGGRPNAAEVAEELARLATERQLQWSPDILKST